MSVPIRAYDRGVFPYHTVLAITKGNNCLERNFLEPIKHMYFRASQIFRKGNSCAY